MSLVLKETVDNICTITLNRTDKHNALDDALLKALQKSLDEAIEEEDSLVVLLKANGKHFSAGADLAWMQKMVELTEEENLEEAMILARVLYTLHTCPKPTIASIQGSAFGGGAGLAAVCDISIASQSALFCFSEVRLGLIPAVISPYVIEAMGARAAKALFISAEPFNAEKALALQLIQHAVPAENLETFTLDFARKITHLAPQAVCEAKSLIETVKERPIDETLIRETARLIAHRRVSREAQRGLHAFLNKQQPQWNQ